MAEEEPLGAEREPTWDQKVVRLNAALAERGVPYAFGGAIALNYHREPRSTLDIDLKHLPLARARRHGAGDAWTNALTLK